MESFTIGTYINSTFTCFAQHKRTKVIYILKIRPQQRLEEKRYDQEVKTLLRLTSCPLLVPFHDSFCYDFSREGESDWGKKQCLLFTYYEKGNLQEYIIRNNEPYTLKMEKQIVAWAYQLCEGLEFLHSNNVIHQSFESSNIFLDSKQGIKIGEVGLTSVNFNPKLNRADNVRSLAHIFLDLLTGSIAVEGSAWSLRIKKIPILFSGEWKFLLENMLIETDSKQLTLRHVRNYLDKISLNNTIVTAEEEKGKSPFQAPPDTISEVVEISSQKMVVLVSKPIICKLSGDDTLAEN